MKAKKPVYKFLFCISFLFHVSNSFSQSPLTNICFYKVYSDFGVVEEAEKAGYMNYNIAQELMNPLLSTDVKAAIINALSFEILGTENAQKFVFYMQLKYRFSSIDSFVDQLSADEIFCLAYLTVMDDYFNPQASFKYFEKALSKNPESFTYNLIYSLVKAQDVFIYDRCKAWKQVELVLNNLNYTGLMLPEAIALITEFMKVYQTDCL